jgi:hypothetical protein
MLGHGSGGVSHCLVRVYVWCKCNTMALGYMTCHALIGKQPYNHLSNDNTCALSNHFQIHYGKHYIWLVTMLNKANEIRHLCITGMICI